MILLSNLGLGLDYMLMAMAPTLAWLFVGRVISGITSASYPTAGAYIADVTPPAERAGKFGMLGAAFGLGFIVGPAVGGLLGGIDLRLPFWVAAGLSLANATYGYFILPESLPPERRKPFSLRNCQHAGFIRLLRSHPELLGMAAALFVMGLAHESLPNTFVLYADQRYGWSEIAGGPRAGGDRRGFGGRLDAAGQAAGAQAGRATRGDLSDCSAAWWVSCASRLASTRQPVPGRHCRCLALLGIANPSFQSLMSHRVDATEQGQLQGALGSIRAVTGMLGPDALHAGVRGVR